MDPYYFLDIELEENEDDIGIHEYCDISPDGNWIINPDNDYKILYKDKEYTCIIYNNEHKIISFYENNTITKTLKLTLIDIGEVDVPPPYEQNP